MLYYFSQIAAAKDPDTSFFRKLDGFQPCELTELKAGTHVFAVYGKCLLLYPIGTFEKTNLTRNQIFEENSIKKSVL